MATKQETITRFHLYMDDTTELSSAEESDLYDKVYDDICTEMPWEFLKAEATGTTSTSVPYVALPSDFDSISENHNYTDIGYESSLPVVFVGSTYRPYKVINFSDRRQYRDQDGYCYIDYTNDRLYFTKQPTSEEAYEFDYIKDAPALAVGESPLFPAKFHHLIFHGMCVDDFVIQQSDKARSYRNENVAEYQRWLDKLKYWNSRLIQMN